MTLSSPSAQSDSIPAFEAGRLDLGGGRVAGDEPSHFLGHRQQLEDPDATAVAAAAVVAGPGRQSSVTVSSSPSLTSSSCDGAYDSRQYSQSRRASLWARTAETAEATTKGSTPISVSRVIALGASFVCSVERTKWPVSAARIEISAVSRSRISPTITTSGSLRKTRAKRLREVEVDLRVDLQLVDAGQPVLDGVLDRDHVDLRTRDVRERRIERRRLAGAGRAGDEQERRSAGSAGARAPSASGTTGRSRSASAHRVTCRAGAGSHPRLRPRGGSQTRMSIWRPLLRAQRDAAVLRAAVLGDVELRQHLDARDVTPAARWRGMRSSSRSTPSMRMRTKRPSCWGRKVNVAGAFLGGLEDDRVDELHERTGGVVLRRRQALPRTRTPLPRRAPTVARIRADARGSAARARSRHAERPRTTTSRLVASRSSSSDCTSSGSLIATRTLSPSKAYGNGVRAHQDPRIDHLGGRTQHAGRTQVDEVQLVVRGELARDGGAAGPRRCRCLRHQEARISLTCVASSCGLNGFVT